MMIEDYLEQEWYVVRHSGEIPEIALHSSFYYLIEDCDGPQLTLSLAHKSVLIEAAAERFREIILRDLSHENRDKREYRGVGRAVVNYQRYKTFCQRQCYEDQRFAGDVAYALLLFLAAEQVIARGESVDDVLNCSFSELCAFGVELGLVQSAFPESVAALCQGAFEEKREPNL